MTLELMPWAQELAADFERQYGDCGCTCFISPPCGHCTHPGHPICLECTPEAWGEVHVVMAEEALTRLKQFVDDLAAKHLAAMQESWSS
jgi:hypothetical protein